MSDAVPGHETNMDIIGQLPLDLQLIIFDVVDYQTLKAFARTNIANLDSVTFFNTFST